MRPVRRFLGFILRFDMLVAGFLLHVLIEIGNLGPDSVGIVGIHR
jgi:hypothetical protein